MALNKQSDFINALLITAVILVPGTATTNVDCKGKAFHCVNSTHFKICVDFGGVSKTVDDFLIPCPPSTACTDSNYYECEIPTTWAPLARESDVTNELFETTITSPWELLDVITLSPINNNEKSVELLENSTIASPEIVSTAAGTETVEIVDNKVINDITTESEYIIHKTTTSDLSESNNSKSKNSIPNSYMTSLAITDKTNDLSGHNISANISSASVIIGNNSTTESKIWLDVLDTMTPSSNTKDDADFKSTNLFNSVITDSLNKNNLSAALTTENYLGTKSEISIDLYKSFITAFPDTDKISTTLSFPLKTNDFRLNIPEEATKNYEVTEFDTSISMIEQVETTPKNIERSGDFATTISSVRLKTDDLGLKSLLAAETTEKSGTENETFITNNTVNTHFTTTLLLPLMTESIQNTPNIEINLSVTSDSYSTSTEQYSTVSDKNSPIETTTTTNDMYTNATVTGTGAENETMLMNNNVTPHFTKTILSAPMITEGLLNTSIIEIYLTVTSDSYSTNTEQYPKVSYKNSPTKTATTTNEMYTNANVNGVGTENKKLITNTEVNPNFTTTILSAPMITEGLVNTPNIEIYLSDTSDSYSTSFEQYSTVSYKNSPTETATTTNEMYTNANVNGTGTENKILITNNEVNPHLTTTTLSAPMVTEGLIYTPNIEIYLSDTSDSYSTSFEQFSTVSDTNTPTETATATNELYKNANFNGTGTENKTLITNNKVNPHFTTTTLSAPMITEGLVNTPNIEIYLSDTSDSYSTSFEQYSTVRYKNSPTETATTTNEMYTNANVNGTGTENKIFITNNEVNPHFTTTTLSAPMITEGLINTPNIEIYLSDTSDSYSTSFEQFSTVSDTNTPTETATTTNELHKNANVTGIGTKHETLIKNTEVNPHFTTTTLSAPMITDSLTNTQNIEIPNNNFTVTSDSNSAGTEQYSTVRDNNSPTVTAESTNQMYTQDVTKTSDSSLDGYSLNENDMNMTDEISSSSPIQMELNSTTTVNVVLRDTLQVLSINEQSNQSSPVGSVVSLNAENVTSSDITKFTTDLDQTNTQANVLYTKAPIVNENNIILDTNGTSTTKLDDTINENSLMRENIANSSTDINLTTRSDSSETNVTKNTPERDTNSRTPTTRTASDIYTTVTNKKIQVDEFSIYENDSSTIPLSDFLSTVGYDEELNPTTAVNIVLKNTADTILTKEQSDISPQKSERRAISDLINNEPQETTTLQPKLAIDLTVNYISYDVNFSSTTVNGNKLHKNVAKKISNNTKDEFLRHENGTYENIIDEITTHLPQIADFKSTAKAENVAASFIGSLNDTVEELKMTGTSDLFPPVTTTGSPSVSEIIKTNLLSDITESYYVANTEPHIDVTKVKLPIFSTIDETIQNNPTTQNIVTEILDGTENEHGSTRNFEIQQHENITNFDRVSSPSVFLHFSKHNDNSTEPFNNRLKENDSDSNIMYGSSHPLNVSTSTSKSNTKYTAEHNTEHTINLTIIENLTETSATQPRITLNDKVLNFSALEPIFNLTVGNEIAPTENHNRLSTVNNVYDNIITTQSYIRDGTGERSHLTEGDILKTMLLNEKPSMSILGTDLNPSVINDRYKSVSDDIYSSTSAKNTVTENYSYKNNLPDYVIDSSTSASSVIDSFDLNTVISTLVTGSTSFADADLASNITSMGFEYKYTTKENVTLTNVPTDSSQIFVTNEKPIHTATLYRNVNSSTESNTLKGTKVVELEQLVSEDTNKIFASDTTSDISSLTTENTLSLTPTLSKNISRQHILSTNIDATKEKFTRDSALSGGLYVQDKILKSVNIKLLQNTSIITNESPQYQKNNNTYNFTKQIINTVVVNNNANLYNANVKITKKKQNQTLDPFSKSIVNFNNLSINVENLTRHYQNSSYNVPNKTRIGDMQLHFVINAYKKQNLSNPVQANEDKRKVHITKITPVKVNNLPSNEIERSEFKFNCDSRQRGKYSDKNYCQNFYICTGRDEPIIGKCPNNTVFSEILKQCTRNLSHCIRNNQFQCTSAGRFVDILSNKFYYICAKKVKGYIRFKFQCQKGYHLDKSKLKCILDTFNESLSAFDMDVSNEESSKTVGEKSTIESRSKEEKDSKKQKKNFECKKEGKFLFTDDCRKYYQCTKTGESKFRRKIKKCDSDEVFDNEMRKCVDEESYEC